MICQQAEKTQAKKRWQGLVHFFIHPLWICFVSFWPATLVRHQLFNHEWLHSIHSLASDLFGG